jgi:hypothetical protein
VPFVATIHPEVIEIAAAGLAYWGGWYWDEDGNYVDAMHLEFMARPRDVARAIRQMKAKYAEIKLRREEQDVDREKTLLVQRTLNAIGTYPPVAEDGLFGTATTTALVNAPALVARRIDEAEALLLIEVKTKAKAAIDAVEVNA